METRKETLALLPRTKPDSVMAQFRGLDPGTPWFHNPARFGFEVDLKVYPERVMDYKIRLLFPPIMWKGPGYKVDSKNLESSSWKR